MIDVRDRRLAGGLPLVLLAHDVLRLSRCARRGAPRSRRAAASGEARTRGARCSSCTTYAVCRSAGSGTDACSGVPVDARHAGRRRRGAPRAPSSISSARRLQVLDERQLQHARPRPQLADRQRRDALEAVEEAASSCWTIEAAVAVPDQLDGHRVDARVARAARASASGGSSR